MYDQERVVEAAAMFTKAMELAPGDFEIAFTAAGYLRYFSVEKKKIGWPDVFSMFDLPVYIVQR